MSEVSAALQRLIEIRGRNLPIVQRETERWQAVDALLEDCRTQPLDRYTA
ncbi:hypothetical protein AB0M95_17345 [Sphaerisporangium sp. NPDC051017]